VSKEDHHLTVFSGDPAACINPDLDNWEDILNPMMKQVFDWGSIWKTFKPWGDWHDMWKNGLDGFYKFTEYFFTHYGLKVALMETKFGILIKAIEFECIIPYHGHVLKTHDHNFMTKIPIHGCTDRSPKR